MVRRLLLFVVLLVVLSGSTVATGQEEQLEWNRFDWQRFEVAGRPAFVVLPPAKERQSPLPWVFYAPTFDQLLPNERDEGWMIARFLDAGMAIAGIDVGESYGSPDGVAAFDALYEHLVASEWNFDTKASLLARSRGGLMLYNWASENPDRVACIAGIYPVCDLESYPGLEKASAAYGMTPAELAGSLDAFNPIARLQPLAKAKIPIFHIHGDVDEVVPSDANTQVVSDRYGQLGGNMSHTVALGQGHNMWPGFFRCEQLVDFVIEHGHPQEWSDRTKSRSSRRYAMGLAGGLFGLAFGIFAVKRLRRISNGGEAATESER